MGEVIDDEESMLHGQAQVWKYMFHFVDSMALKSAVELRIADIIHSHAQPITLSQIAAGIDSPSPITATLSRILRLLVRRNIFTATVTPDDGSTVYGLTPASRWLLHDAELSMAPLLLLETHPLLIIAGFHYLSSCVKEGGFAFKKAHGMDVFETASCNPEFNNMFNHGMVCMTQIISKAIVSGYKDGFCSVGSLVDVGGGTGATVAEIVKAFPHIKGINFDLPHVVATAPEYQGVSHVGGDMFKSIPAADAIFIKWVFHNWGDEYCMEILKNCRKALSEKTGKLIIVDAVLKPEGDEKFGDLSYVMDLVMLSNTDGGKERTDEEWKKLLTEGGFPNYKIIQIPAWLSIIEAYPQ